ncbi:MAG: glycosyltransferase [Phycisphaerae bacterium]|nr:glycosyltransferase [Phycisphaerae bacterium]
MKIVHVLDTLDPRDGGPPQVAMRQASALAALGHDVAILHCKPTPDRVEHVRSTIDGVPGYERVTILELPPEHIHRFLGRAHPASLECLRGAEWLQLHQIWHPMLRAVARWARENEVPYSMRPAGSLSRWMLEQKRWKKKVGLALGYRRMIDGAQFLQALNKDEAHAISIFKPRPPIETVSNGIFPEEIAPLPPGGVFRAQHERLASRRYVVSVGRLHYSKGYDVLVPAFARVAREVSDVDLVLIGPDGGKKSDLEAIAKTLGIAERVHLVGPVYGRNKFAALVDAACFCLPSRHEAFSNAITEALACGLPCVISPGAHFPEVAEVGAGMIVEIEEVAIAAALLSILRDQGRAQTMGERGRLLAHSYLWPEIAERLASLFRRYRAERRSS